MGEVQRKGSARFEWKKIEDDWSKAVSPMKIEFSQDESKMAGDLFVVAIVPNDISDRGRKLIAV